MIHFYRVYLTPACKFRMNLSDSGKCNIWSSTVGTYMHMFWYYDGVYTLWMFISDTVRSLLNKPLLVYPVLFLLGFSPAVHLRYIEMRILGDYDDDDDDYNHYYYRYWCCCFCY